MRQKLKYTIYAMVVFSIIKVQAQTFCFTPPESSNMELYATALSRSKVAATYCLKIYVHVIRRSNGTGGQSVSETNQAINYLNTDFNPHGVTFAWDGTIDYIDNDSYYSAPTTTIYTVNNHSDGIDIYLYDDQSNAGGRANGVGDSSEFWVSGSYWKAPFGSLVKSHVISHEMGHVLFLWHTHHGTVNEGGDPGQCAELVNGSNATTCGDYISDTPADPHLQFNVNHPACNWTSSGTDANGHSYNPDEALIMAYSHPDCMSYFSNGQGQRIRNAIATLPHLINATVNCNNGCPTTLNITQNVPSGATDNQEAKVSITANNTIQANATATYSAGQKVILKTGFKALNGSKFTAKIEDCSTNRFVENNTIIGSENYKKTDLDETDFIIHPNPSKDIITIRHKDIDAQNYTIHVYDLFGIQKMNKPLLQNSKLNISNLPEGMYYIKLSSNNGKVYTKKMLIQR